MTRLYTTRLISDNPFQPRVPFHIETSHFVYTTNQMTGFYMKCITELSSVIYFQKLTYF